MTLASRVKEQRYAKGWGPDELALRASISRTALYQIESGKTENPRAATLRRIAVALEVPIESLLGRRVEVSAPQNNAFAPERRFRFDDDHATNPRDLDRKFRELLASPLGEGVARIVEESYRILPLAPLEARW